MAHPTKFWEGGYGSPKLSPCFIARDDMSAELFAADEMAMPDVVALNLHVPVVFMGCFGSTLISGGNISLFQRRDV